MRWRVRSLWPAPPCSGSGQSRLDRVGGRERGFGARGRSKCAHLSRSGLSGSGRAFWDASARGAIFGLSRAASKADLVAAGLEAVAFQTRDLLTAMRQDMAASGITATSALPVDGGMTANAWFLQRLADILGRTRGARLQPRDRRRSAPPITRDRRWASTAMRKRFRRLGAPARAFEPTMTEAEREARYGGWPDAVARVRTEGAPLA